MKVKYYLLPLFFSLTIAIQSIAEDHLLRYPALSSDGSKIAFSYQGDIWTVPVEGGKARRLTVHESYESHPQWSTDDSQISFRSNRFGNNDVYVMDADGSVPKRLTHFSGNDVAAKWDGDGNLFFNTRRLFAQVERESEVYRVSARGGTPFRAMDAVGLSPAPSQEGRFLAIVRGNCRVEREAYNGPANRDIWVYNRKNKSFNRLTNFSGQDVKPDWGKKNQLFYLKAMNKKYNIVSQIIDNSGKGVSGEVVHTSFVDHGVRNFDVSANGESLVFSRGTGIYVMKTSAGAAAKKIDVQISSDYYFDPVETKNYSNAATELAISPNGKYQALVIRGEIFVKLNDKEKKRLVQLTKHAYRDENVAWLNDSTLLFTSDREGNKDLYMIKSNDKEEASLYRSLKHDILRLGTSDVSEETFLLSPDRKKIAIRKDRGLLTVAEITSKGRIKNEFLLHNSWSTPKDIAWSPDSKWLSYVVADLNFNNEVYIREAKPESKPVNVSMHPRGDYSPVWSCDGSKLGFLSIRNNGDADVWFAWLNKADWEKSKADWDEDDEIEDAPELTKKSKGKKGEKEEGKANVKELVIDLEGIHERLRQVSSAPGNEGDLVIDKDGEWFFFTTNNGSRAGSEGKQALVKTKWDGSEQKTVLPDAKIRRQFLGPDHEKIYMIKSQGTIASMKTSETKATNLPFAGKMKIDHLSERKQIFTEAWEVLNKGFYDPGFHGQDFSALRKQYLPIAMMASTSQDFRDVFNEMLGQLNASHMGLYGSNPEETQSDRTGLLGIEVVPFKSGVKVTKVLAGSPGDREASKLEKGDVIVAVNGEKLTADMNFYALLNGTVNERILLELDKAEDKELVIRPTASLSAQNYDAWVNDRKKLVERYSGGRLGYIHIRGMNWQSFERFERELMASGMGKDGIVIDVRFNGGGWTTDMLMAVLNVKQHSYTVPRGAADDLKSEHQKFKEYYPYGERLPLSSWTKPSVALCNENSYSNAEIFSHAYKSLGLGTLVGKPTFGAVISTSGQGLIDGSFVRLPFRGWYVKATGENMEHGPAVPDVIVFNPPDAKAKNNDPQLKKAVEVLLGQID